MQAPFLGRFRRPGLEQSTEACFLVGLGGEHRSRESARALCVRPSQVCSVSSTSLALVSGHFDAILIPFPFDVLPPIEAGRWGSSTSSSYLFGNRTVLRAHGPSRVGWFLQDSSGTDVVPATHVSFLARGCAPGGLSEGRCASWIGGGSLPVRTCFQTIEATQPNADTCTRRRGSPICVLRILFDRCRDGGDGAPPSLDPFRVEDGWGLREVSSARSACRSRRGRRSPGGLGLAGDSSSFHVLFDSPLPDPFPFPSSGSFGRRRGRSGVHRSNHLGRLCSIHPT